MCDDVGYRWLDRTVSKCKTKHVNISSEKYSKSSLIICFTVEFLQPNFNQKKKWIKNATDSTKSVQEREFEPSWTTERLLLIFCCCKFYAIPLELLSRYLCWKQQVVKVSCSLSNKNMKLSCFDYDKTFCYYITAL